MEGLKAGSDPNSIVVKKESNVIVISRGGDNIKYGILTNVIYTIEVITDAGKTDVKIKQANNEIGEEWRNRENWDGKWGGDIVAIEYPNKDLWSDHPVLNEMKLTSLVSSMVGGSEEPVDSNEKSSTEQQKETQKGNYQNGYLVFTDKK